MLTDKFKYDIVITDHAEITITRPKDGVTKIFRQYNHNTIECLHKFFQSITEDQFSSYFPKK